MKKGTPKCLKEAIMNGLEEYGFYNNSKIADFILPHVRDFIAQKSFHKDEEIDRAMKILFEKITREAA